MRVYLCVIMAGALFAIAGQQTAWAQRGPSRPGSSRTRLDPAGELDISTAGQIQGNERFIRGNRQPGEFVGADRDADFVGAPQAGATPSGRRSQRRLGSQANRGGNQPNRSSRNSRDAVRTHIRLGFSVVRPTVTDVAPRLHRQLGKITLPKAGSPIQITVEKGTVILRGAVASAHDRAIAERLVLLEGGIWKVKNELTVSEAESQSPPK